MVAAMPSGPNMGTFSACLEHPVDGLNVSVGAHIWIRLAEFAEVIVGVDNLSMAHSALTPSSTRQYLDVVSARSWARPCVKKVRDEMGVDPTGIDDSVTASLRGYGEGQTLPVVQAALGLTLQKLISTVKDPYGLTLGSKSLRCLKLTVDESPASGVAKLSDAPLVFGPTAKEGLHTTNISHPNHRLRYCPMRFLLAPCSFWHNFSMIISLLSAY